MLDQPVPNPLAKNPNIHTHKVFAAIGLILIGTMLALFAASYVFGFKVSDLFFTPSEPETTKVATNSPRKSINADTSNWKYYSSDKYKYSYKYPENWLTAACDDSFFHSPTKESLGICATEFGGMVNLSYLDTNYTEYVNQEGFTDVSYLEKGERKEVTVNGKPAVRISGFYKDVDGSPYKSGAQRIFYIVNLNEKVLFINYYSEEGWGDYSETFEQIVSTITYL